jgi:hypothetical protein
MIERMADQQGVGFSVDRKNGDVGSKGGCNPDYPRVSWWYHRGNIPWVMAPRL